MATTPIPSQSPTKSSLPPPITSYEGDPFQEKHGLANGVNENHLSSPNHFQDQTLVETPMNEEFPDLSHSKEETVVGSQTQGIKESEMTSSSNGEGSSTVVSTTPNTATVPAPKLKSNGKSTYPPKSSTENQNSPTHLSHYLTAHPTKSVNKAIKSKYPRPNPLWRLIRRFKVRHNVISGLTEEEMKLWEKREGRERRRVAGWKLESEGDEDGVVVSELFWKMYTSCLPTLERDPLSGLVPPSLLGSTTTVPLSIISLIPDIMKHYRDCIVRAEKEVWLITNYWQPSNSVTTIGSAMRELSEKRIKEAKESGKAVEKIVFKLIYDRGSWEQLVNAHANVPPPGWEVLKIPSPEEIPGIDLQVMNYHKVLLGTLHVKFCVIDRKVALINSNNIQDRPNLEMCSHLEGPIVDAFYEAALLTWYNPLLPMMPCINSPYRTPTAGYTFQEDNPYLADIEVLKAAKAARVLLRKQTKDAQAAEELAGERFVDVVRRTIEAQRDKVEHRWNEWGTDEDGNHITWGDRVRLGLGSRQASRRPSMEVNDHDPATPLAQTFNHLHHIPTINSETQSSANQASPTLNGDSTELPKTDTAPLPPTDRQVKIVEPVVNEGAVTKSAGDSPTTSAEASASGSGEKPLTRPRSGSARMQALSERFNAGALSEAWATVEDSDDLDSFQPHVLHKPHDPFPVAMVCRKPHGLPGHHDIRNPQNAAWLAGFRYAKKRVFIQTPTLNARPIRRAIKQTCRRGVEVILFLDLGFNDKGESIPFQGGTNEEVVVRLYNLLGPENKAQFLKVYWYTGKDQIRPLNAVKKQRNCHVKFANFDDEVAIYGNGNQDTQSWFHSSEANIMIDSKTVIAELMETLYSNQNTQLYGLVGEDGLWRDSEGKDLTHYDTSKKDKHRGLAGFIQFAKTI